MNLLVRLIFALAVIGAALYLTTTEDNNNWLFLLLLLTVTDEIFSSGSDEK